MHCQNSACNSACSRLELVLQTKKWGSLLACPQLLCKLQYVNLAGLWAPLCLHSNAACMHAPIASYINACRERVLATTASSAFGRAPTSVALRKQSCTSTWLSVQRRSPVRDIHVQLAVSNHWRRSPNRKWQWQFKCTTAAVENIAASAKRQWRLGLWWFRDGHEPCSGWQCSAKTESQAVQACNRANRYVCVFWCICVCVSVSPSELSITSQLHQPPKPPIPCVCVCACVCVCV